MNEEELLAPLWSDDRIIHRYKIAFGVPPTVHIMALLRMIRDEYEEERNATNAPIDPVGEPIPPTKKEKEIPSMNELIVINAMATELERLRAQVKAWEGNGSAPEEPRSDLSSVAHSLERIAESFERLLPIAVNAANGWVQFAYDPKPTHREDRNA